MSALRAHWVLTFGAGTEDSVGAGEPRAVGTTRRLSFRRGGRSRSRRAVLSLRTPAIACVLGTINLVRPLGLARIPCAVVARQGDPARFSRFTVASVDWLDPAAQPERLVERLVQFGISQPEQPVLFYEGDNDLLCVSRFRDRLRPLSGVYATRRFL